MKTFSLELLGQGKKKAGGAQGQKQRFDVLDRMSRLGSGLSPEQRNDWHWFKTTWDAKMVSEHDHEWPNVFVGIIQSVFENLAQEGHNNAFSVFVHGEALRCLSDDGSLRIPVATSSRA